jgi:hypothetical protein
VNQGSSIIRMSKSRSTDHVRTEIEGFATFANENSTLQPPKAEEPLVIVDGVWASHLGKVGQGMMEDEEFGDPAPLTGLNLTNCEVSPVEGSSEYDTPQRQDLIAGVGRNVCCSELVSDHNGVKLPDKGTAYCCRDG